MLRDVEDMSTTDAADYARAGMERKEVFTFHAVRCDRVVKNVFERIQKQVPKTGTSAAKTQ
jgi:hypothetical protein